MKDYTFFLNGFMSQWSRSEFEIDGIIYNCAEQYMMCEKARLFQDMDAEKTILKTDHPKEQKAIGRLVRNFEINKWNANARNIVYRGNYAKFSQNEKLRQWLLDTGDSILAEAAQYDKVWGIGLDEKNELILDENEWQGTNWLGEVLMKVREDIVKEESKEFNWK